MAMDHSGSSERDSSIASANQAVVLQAGFSADDAAWLQARIGSAMHVLHCLPTPKAVEEALTAQVKMVVVQFDIRQDLEAPERLTQWLRETKPEMPVLGMGYANTPKVPLAALRGGTHDFLDMSNVSDEQLKPFWALSMRSYTQQAVAASNDPVRRGKVLALIGARPGMGVSTLAAHLSAALAQRGSHGLSVRADALADREGIGVGLLDLGFPLRDGLMYMGLQSSFHMVDAIHSMHRLDPALLEAALPRHRCGPAVLPWPAQAQAMREIDPRATSAMVQRLRAFFTWQVVDLGGVPSEDLVEAAAQEADYVWAVCDQSVGGLVSLTELVKAIPKKSSGKPMFDGLVLNRVTPNSGMSPDDIARRLGIPLLSVLPSRDAAMLEAFSRGLLLSEFDAKDAYVTKVNGLAQKMDFGAGLTVERPQKKWLSWMSQWRAHVIRRKGSL